MFLWSSTPIMDTRFIVYMIINKKDDCNLITEVHVNIAFEQSLSQKSIDKPLCLFCFVEWTTTNHFYKDHGENKPFNWTQTTQY